MVVTNAGRATGVARMVPLMAASIKPMLRTFLKNLGVGADALCIRFIVIKFKVYRLKFTVGCSWILDFDLEQEVH
jgi:hypothetical protein